MSDPTSTKNNLLQYARSLGFERIGVTPAVTLERDGAALQEWLAQGCAANMEYMAKDPARRFTPESLLPGARSVVALAMPYFTEASKRPGADAKISRYAWGKDYHKVIGKRLEAFVRYAESLAPSAQFRTFVDAGPILERPYAQQAGLGFIGKNTLLITKGLGSWVFLAHVLTTLDLPADAPDLRSCGSCRLCLDACPTGAIDRPFHVDARRCISYLTIENDTTIPEDLRGPMGGWVFGCDICQEVCPHNTRIPSTILGDFQTGPQAQITLAEILALRTDLEFHARFAGTPLSRAGRSGLVRNACVVAVNLKRTDLLPALQTLAEEDAEPVIREHAAHAVSDLRRVDRSR